MGAFGAYRGAGALPVAIFARTNGATMATPRGIFGQMKPGCRSC